jgi:membrane fusion protein (multidrug efflux system)
MKIDPRTATILALVLSVSACGSPPPAAPAPSVAVQTEPPRQGSLPRIVIAYGTAAPAINGSVSMSVQIDGRIAAIHATPGEAVRAGQPLLDFEVSAAARSAYEQARTAVNLAREERARTERLLAQQLSTQDLLAKAVKAQGDAEASLAALDREYGGAPQRTLTAPFDGVVGQIPVAQGARVPAGSVLVTVTRRGGLLVTVGVEPAQRRQLHLGDPAQLTSLAGQATSLQGKVVRIDQALNTATRLVNVDVAVDEPLLQGEAYRAEIVAGQFSGWLVPHDAVLSDDHGAYVFQLDGAKAVRVAVTLVGGDTVTSVVAGNLDATRPLVTSGNYQLSDGMQVRPAGGSAQPSGSSRPGAAVPPSGTAQPGDPAQPGAAVPPSGTAQPGDPAQPGAAAQPSDSKRSGPST